MLKVIRYRNLDGRHQRIVVDKDRADVITVACIPTINVDPTHQYRLESQTLEHHTGEYDRKGRPIMKPGIRVGTNGHGIILA